MIVGAGSLRGGAAEPVLQHGRELAGEPPAPGELVFSNMYTNLSTIITIFREGASTELKSVKLDSFYGS